MSTWTARVSRITVGRDAATTTSLLMTNMVTLCGKPPDLRASASVALSVDISVEIDESLVRIDWQPARLLR